MRKLAIALLACALIAPVAAQVRPMPADAKRGSMTHVQGNIVNVDGNTLRLSPGAQIRSQDNLIIVPMSLPPGSLVKYSLDGVGDIRRVWVLTPDEAAAPEAKPQ